MSDPAPSPPAAVPAAPQKRVSGYLIFSLLLSIGGLFFRPLLGIGALIGIVLAIVGRKKAKADPMLIGPRLAIWCLGIGIACLGLQGYHLYRLMPWQAFWDSVGTAQREFIETLQAGDYDRLFEQMDPEEGAHTDAASLESALRGYFDGKSFDPKKAVFREDAVDQEKFQADVEKLLAEPTGEMRFTFPYEVEVGGKALLLDFDLRIERQAYATFQAWVSDFRVAEKPAEEAAPKETGEGEEAPASEKTGD